MKLSKLEAELDARGFPKTKPENLEIGTVWRTDCRKTHDCEVCYIVGWNGYEFEAIGIAYDESEADSPASLVNEAIMKWQNSASFPLPAEIRA
jgi:hypothetical protein